MASYGVEDGGKRRFCSQHAEDGMANLCAKTCTRRGCAKIATFGVRGIGSAEACAEHAGEGMVDCPQMKCSRAGCPIMQAMRGTGGAAKFFLCAEHLGEKGSAPSGPRRRPDGTAVKSEKLRPRSEESTDGAESVVCTGAQRDLSMATPVTAVPPAPDAEASKRARTNAFGMQLLADSTANEALTPASLGAAGGAPRGEAHGPALCIVPDETLEGNAVTSIPVSS